MRIENPASEHLPQLEALWREAFGDEADFMEAFFTGAYSPARCRVVTDGKTVAAMVHWLDGEYRGRSYAYLYAVATRTDFRGRGLCRMLLADTKKELARLGYAGALLYPAEDDLRAMYGNMGFRDRGEEREWTCTAGEPISVRKISKEEYASLRRTWLPADGLRQEGENLDLLEKTVDLYAGSDFLLAAYRDGESLIGIELLGGEGVAPGIVAALSCETGVFHRGRKTMFCPLAEDAEAPGYVGLVFD